MNELKEKIAELFNHGMSDSEVVAYLHTGKAVKELGRMLREEDLVYIIRDLMVERIERQ